MASFDSGPVSFMVLLPGPGMKGSTYRAAVRVHRIHLGRGGMHRPEVAGLSENWHVWARYLE